MYTEAGADVVAGTDALYAGAAAVVRVQPPTADDVAPLPDGIVVLSFCQPAASVDALKALAAKKASVFSLDLVPRISRAQSMDALSSQATVSGYRAALDAAEQLAEVLPDVHDRGRHGAARQGARLGAGVAGLQAIATARRLGAVVRAYDVRPRPREEVGELGAAFVDLGLEARKARAATRASCRPRNWPRSSGR